MRLLISFALFIACCAAITAADTPSYQAFVELQPAPSVAPDMPSDPAVQWGTLDNGVIWAVQRNDQPPGKVALRCYIQAGSLQETPPQRGVAHYLEHLAFNGSENFPAGTMIERLQESGIGFGNHLNAHTGFEETVYKLGLPDTQAATLDLGFQVLSDQAGRLLLLPEEIESERGVILAEMRDRDGPQLRIWRQLYAALFPGLTLADRFPIGTEATVSAMGHEEMSAYYENWYRPDRLVVTAVGDVDPQAFISRIEQYFGGQSGPGAAADHPDYGSWVGAGTRTVAIHEPEADGTGVRIITMEPHAPQPDSVELRRTALLETLGGSILSRRLATMAEEDTNTPFLDASGSVTDLYAYRGLYIGGQAKEGRALDTVRVLENELRRFLEYGPTAAEVDIAVRQQRSALDQAVARQDTRSNEQLARAMYAAVRDQRVLMSPEQSRDFYDPLLDSVDAASIRSVWAERMQVPATVVSVAGREQVAGDEAVMDAWTQARTVTLAAPEEETAAQWVYDQKPAEPAEPEIASLPLGVDVATYGNNITAAILPRDAKPNEVLISVRLHIPSFSGGIGQRAWLGRSFQAGGLGELEASALREALADVRARVAGPDFEADAAVFVANTTPDELEVTLQQLRAWLTDPGWREQGAVRSRARWLEALEAESTDLDAVVGRRWDRIMHDGMPSLRMPTMVEVQSLDWSSAQAWFEPLLGQGALEVAIVGDVDSGSALALIDHYLGTLPTRAPVPVAEDLTAPGALPPAPALTPVTISDSISATVRRAVVRQAWPTDDAGDVHRTRRLGVLAACMREILRKRIREEFGEAYSPYAVNRSSSSFDGRGVLLVHISVEPDQVEPVTAILQEEMERLIADGVDADVFNRVMTPMVKNLDAYRDTNRYWLQSVVAQVVSQPQRIAWAQDMADDFAAIQRAEINDLAQRYLTSTAPIAVTITSDGSAAEQSAETASEDGNDE